MCERCVRGYFGDATGGTPNDCQRCMCNGWAEECVANNMATMGFRCTNCTGNTMGDQCESCLLNHYGRPLNNEMACQPCLPRCNNNIDPLVPGSCDMMTGECLMCIRNTIGTECQTCAPGYFGDATQLNGCQGTYSSGCACNISVMQKIESTLACANRCTMESDIGKRKESVRFRDDPTMTVVYPRKGNTVRTGDTQVFGKLWDLFVKPALF